MELNKETLFNKNTLLFVAAIIAVILLIVVAIWGLRQSPLSRAKIVFWGFDDLETYRPIFKQFNAAYSNIEIDYVQKSPENYEKELLSAMAAGQGPDVYLIRHNWLSRFQNKISPLSSQLMTLKNYYDAYVDVAVQDFVFEGNIYAAPWYVDTLAIYWNKDFFNTAGIAQPPKNWDEFLEDVQKLTLKDENGNILRAGTALGTSNINNSADILSLLMMQGGAKMTDGTRRAAFNQEIILNNEQYKPGKAALEFYTNFSNPQSKAYTWNNRMENSLDSFISGKTAMIFEYSGAASEITSKAPYLNFSVAPTPQVKQTNVAISYADYWGGAVWSGSKNPNEAWAFALWMAGADGQKSYLGAAKKPVSRRDLVSWQESDPALGVFAKQSLSARSWYQVNDEAIKNIFLQMIDSVFYNKTTVDEAVERAANQVNVLMEEAENKNKSGGFNSPF